MPSALRPQHLALAVALIALLPPAAVADRLVLPFAEISDQDLAHIDLHDGSIDDWEDLVGAPALTARDALVGQGTSWRRHYDPSDLHFRIWLAWHDASNRIYAAIERIDDIYQNGYSSPETGQHQSMAAHDSGILVQVDGDRSGGQLYPPSKQGLTPAEITRLSTQKAQAYQAIAEPHGEGPYLMLDGATQDWMLRPPYSDGSGRSFSSNPTVTVLEFYITPFDHLVVDSPSHSVTSDLYPGKRIGFTMYVVDVDDDSWALYGFTDAVPSLQLELLPHGVMEGQDEAGQGQGDLPVSSWATVKHTAPVDSAGVPGPGD